MADSGRFFHEVTEEFLEHFVNNDPHEDDFSEDSDQDTDEEELDDEISALSHNLTLRYRSEDENQLDTCFESEEIQESTGSTEICSTNRHVLSDVCSCKDCTSRIDSDSVDLLRTRNLSLEKTELDLVILGKLAVMTNTSAEVGKASKHTQKQRMKARCSYSHEGIPLCMASWLYLHGISTTRLKNLKKHYSAEGAVPRCFNYKGRNNKAVTYDDAKTILEFLTRIASLHALDLPGRVPGFRKIETKLLPSSMTVAQIWEMYVESVESIGGVPKKITAFRKVWKQLCPFIIISKPSTDLCWTCQQHNVYYMRNINTSENSKKDLVAKQAAHLQAAQDARKTMNSDMERCQQLCADLGSLGSHPTQPPVFAHYGFDYAQQVFYPSSPQQPGPLYFLTPRKVGLFGVCCLGLPQQVNYVIDEAVMVTKGANGVISYLDHFFKHWSFGEQHVSLHADNCSGQNKNNAMLQYLAWRVATGLHKSITLNFLITGHTKFGCDMCFGLIKRRYRRSDVSCLEDLQKVIEESSPYVNKVQLVGDQNGQVLVPVHAWSEWLGIQGVTVAGIKKFHQFYFSEEKIGYVGVKTYSTDQEYIFHKVLNKAPVGCPNEIRPDGLSDNRQEYLYKSIREYCRPGTEDFVCPEPTCDKAPAKKAKAI